jgi:Ca2+-binding EF-hand superfamily protein
MNIKLKNKYDQENQIKRIFDQLDTNEDNSITKYEFIEGCLKDEFLLHFLSANI